MEIQYDGLSRLNKDSTGSYEYTAEEREYIYRKIGSYELYKQVQRVMNNPRYREQIKALRAHRTTDVDSKNEMIVLKKKLLPVYQEINAILRKAQGMAEAELLAERPDIVDTIRSQTYVNEEMKKGNVEGAAQVQKEQLEKQKLLEYGGSR